MRVGVILVHGIATHTPAWADGIIETLNERVNAEVGRLLPGGRSPHRDELLAAGQVYWGDVLRERQRTLRAILEAGGTPFRAHAPLWYKFLHAWQYAKYAWRKRERVFVSEYVGDVIGYLESGAHAAVQRSVTEALAQLSRQEPGTAGKRPLTMVAHSLGTVISSDYVWDHTKARRAQGQNGFDDRWQLENFFTIGSPMALFSLKFGGPEAFKQPIRMEGPRGRWLNVFDQDDPIGMPLKALNEAYERVVWRDVRVNSGAYLLAHGGYFTEPKTLTLISRKLALDWVAVNGMRPAGELDALYAEYDRTLGLAS